MGVRGEVFSNRVMLPNRTYFFNVKENRMGDLYLNIVESKNRETGGFDRQSVVLFADDLQEFLKGFDESLRALEKAVREKRRTGGQDSKRHSGERDFKHDYATKFPAHEKQYSGERDFKRDSATKFPAHEKRHSGERDFKHGDKRRSGGDVSRRDSATKYPAHERGERGSPRQNFTGEKPFKNRQSFDGERPARNRQNYNGEKPAHNRRPEGDRRVVVKKRK